MLRVRYQGFFLEGLVKVKSTQKVLLLKYSESSPKNGSRKAPTVFWIFQKDRAKAAKINLAQNKKGLQPDKHILS